MNRAYSDSIIKLLNSFDKKRGELSYRAEGVFRTIAIIAPSLANRKKIANAIDELCGRFGLGKDNKDANAALAALDRAEAESEPQGVFDR